MVHRTSEESSPREEAPPIRTFPSSLSRQNSYGESNNGYCEEEFIYYRPPNKDYFQGPFTEVICQFWYKEGYFCNSLEFRFGRDGPIETLESLKARNGRECPFQEGAKKAPYNEMMVKTLIGRVIDLASDLDKVKEERAELQIARKIEIDSLTNRVKELMEDKTRNEEYRRYTDLQLSEMQSQLAELKFSMGVPTAVTAPSSHVVTNEHDIAFCARSEEDVVTEMTAVPHSFGAHDDVRCELERLNSNMHSLDKFTFKLSHKVEKLKNKEAAVHKVIDAIGEGLNSKNGVFDRLAYVEASVEEMQSVVWPGGEGRGEKKTREEEEEERKQTEEEEMKEEVVLPVERVEMRLDQISTPPGVWLSPNNESRFVTTPPGFELLPPPHKTSFTAVADSITAVAMAAWPGGLETTTTPVKGIQVDDWESIGVAVPPSDAPWREDEVKEEEVKEEVKEEKPVDAKSEEEDEEEASEELVLPPHEQQAAEEESTTSDKENLATKMDGAAGMLELIGNGLGMLLQCSESDCEDNAADTDIDRLLAAIKGAKMLQIAESLNHHFAKALVCEVCSTGAKKAELRNAIEYFEHLNRAHFKKCGGADRMIVNQFAYLLEQFKAAIPVPLSISKRQFTERQKKPWMKNKEAMSTPTGKTTGKKKK